MRGPACGSSGVRARDRAVPAVSTISGIGPDYDAARALVAERNLSALVHFTGTVAYADVD